MQTINEKLQKILSDKTVSVPKSEVEALLLSLVDDAAPLNDPKSAITRSLHDLSEKGLQPNGINPEGTLAVISNGLVDCYEYDLADVNVESFDIVENAHAIRLYVSAVGNFYHENSVAASVSIVVPSALITPNSIPTDYNPGIIFSPSDNLSQPKTGTILYEIPEGEDLVDFELTVMLRYHDSYYDPNSSLGSNSLYAAEEYPKLEIGIESANIFTLDLLGTFLATNVSRVYRFYRLASQGKIRRQALYGNNIQITVDLGSVDN